MEHLTSMNQIDKRIIYELSHPKENNYFSELSRLMNIYRGYLKEYSIYEGKSLYDNKYIHNKVYTHTLELKKLFECHNRGDLLECDRYIKKFFKLTANKSTAYRDFPTTKIPANSLFYRSRTKIITTRKEIFHTPFIKRGYIGSNRFSIPGYPCLYLSSSVQCSMYEVSADTKSVICSSAFKNLRDIEVFDFRFFQNDVSTSTKCLIPSIVFYPFKIAAAIPVHKEKKSDEKIVYKEEYIIPQIILHGVIRQRIGKRPIGILYSSSKAIEDNLSQEDFQQYQNLVIPAFFFTNNDYCGMLRSLFTLTNPKKVDDPIRTEKILKSIQFDII